MNTTEKLPKLPVRPPIQHASTMDGVLGNHKDRNDERLADWAYRYYRGGYHHSRFDKITDSKVVK